MIAGRVMKKRHRCPDPNQTASRTICSGIRTPSERKNLRRITHLAKDHSTQLPMPVRVTLRDSPIAPVAGPIFANSLGNPLSLGSVVNRHILRALNRCETCGKAERGHGMDHPYKRDSRIPEWHGWHAARRGLGSNLYPLGVPDIVIQRILRHANVSTTATYYHQDCRRRCSQGDDYAGKPHRG